MRVLHVGNVHSAKVGTRTAAEELGDELRQRGVEVLLTSSRRAPVPKALDMLATVIRRRHDYDVAIVDVYSGRAFRWAEAVVRALERARVPFVLNLVGGELPAFARRAPQRVRRLCSAASALTAPSRFIADNLTAYAGEVRLQPSHGLYLERYPFRERSKCEPSVAWIRAFHEIYAPWMAANTLAHLVERYPGASLRMVGPDKGDGSLQRFLASVEAAGIADHVSVVGSVSKRDVPTQLENADIFLNTTTAESLGVSVLEAMACGLCVVTTDVGSLPELTAGGANGLLVPSGDPVAAASAIRSILEDPGCAAQLSRNGRSMAERYAWSETAPPWLSLLEEVATS